MVNTKDAFSGKAKNFSGQVGERVLKSIVKEDHSQQTQ
jgi:hypothetical protein